MRAQTRALRLLEHRLDTLATHIRTMADPTPEDFLRVMESMTMFDKYYTPEQLEALAKRADELGKAGMRQAEADWEILRAQVKTEMEAGTDPADPNVQALAAKWQSLIDSFTGGDPGIRANLQKVWETRDDIHGIDTAAERAAMEYIGKALAIANQSSQSPSKPRGRRLAGLKSRAKGRSPSGTGTNPAITANVSAVLTSASARDFESGRPQDGREIIPPDVPERSREDIRWNTSANSGPLHERVIIVTGASKGIGRATALRARRGGRAGRPCGSGRPPA